MSPRAIETSKRYRQSKHGKEVRRRAQARYAKSAKGRECNKRFWSKYEEPEALRLKRLVRGRNYNKTPHGRTVRAYHAAKRRALKRKVSVSESEIIKKWHHEWRSANWARCFWCRNWFKGKTCHIDHIIPISRGGPHCIENVCISCAKCNKVKQSKNISEWNNRLLEPVLL